jgi:hypothetical protein
VAISALKVTLKAALTATSKLVLKAVSKAAAPKDLAQCVNQSARIGV